MSVDLVQETRLDLSRAATVLALALAAPGLAHAQPLMPNPGLTSLLQPQQLDRSRPLISPNRSAGTQSGLQPNSLVRGATPCDRNASGSPAIGVPTSPAGPSLFGSGSGPGIYGRYIPGAADPVAKSSTPATPQPGAARTPAADRPLYGGVDRPLWDSGERRTPAGAAGSAPGKLASAGAAGKNATSTDATATGSASTGPVQPNALPAPVRDRPLWAEGSLSGSPNPAAAPLNGPATEAAVGSSVGGGVAVSPCPAAPPPR